eukprot:11170881-Lingulodinium_polyedra.AAC.1
MLRVACCALRVAFCVQEQQRGEESDVLFGHADGVFVAVDQVNARVAQRGLRALLGQVQKSERIVALETTVIFAGR